MRAEGNFAIHVCNYVSIHARAHSPLLFTSSTRKHVASSLAVSLLSSPYLPNVDSYVIDTSVRAQRLLPSKKSTSKIVFSREAVRTTMRSVTSFLPLFSVALWTVILPYSGTGK